MKDILCDGWQNSVVIHFTPDFYQKSSPVSFWVLLGCNLNILLDLLLQHVKSLLKPSQIIFIFTHLRLQLPSCVNKTVALSCTAIYNCMCDIYSIIYSDHYWLNTLSPWWRWVKTQEVLWYFNSYLKGSTHNYKLNIISSAIANVHSWHCAPQKV